MKKILIMMCGVLVLASCNSRNNDLKVDSNKDRVYKNYLEVKSKYEEYNSYSAVLTAFYNQDESDNHTLNFIEYNYERLSDMSSRSAGVYILDDDERCSYEYTDEYMYIKDEGTKIKLRVPNEKMDFAERIFSVKKEDIQKIEKHEDGMTGPLYNVYLDVKDDDVERIQNYESLKNVVIKEITSKAISIQIQADGEINRVAFAINAVVEIEGKKDKLEFGYSISFSNYNEAEVKIIDMDGYTEVDSSEHPYCVGWLW